MAETRNTDTPAPTTIPYWGYFSSGMALDYDPLQTLEGKQFLDAWQKQVDPNASFYQTAMGGHPVWYFRSDKKPPGGVDLNPNAYAPQYLGSSTGESVANMLEKNPGGYGFQAPVVDPSKVDTADPWGKYTDWSNVKTDDSMWWWGPAAVLGSVFAFPALASAMSGGALGGAGAAGAAAAPLDTSSDFYLGMGSGFPEPYAAVPSSGGGLLSNAPLGSAESSLYGTGVQAAPETALGGGGIGTQAAAPIVDRSTNAGLIDQLRNNPLGVLQNPGLLSQLGQGLGGLLGGIPGLGTGGGGGMPITVGGRGGSAGDITEMIRRFYGLDQLAAAKMVRDAQTRRMGNA